MTDDTSGLEAAIDSAPPVEESEASPAAEPVAEAAPEPIEAAAGQTDAEVEAGEGRSRGR